MLAQTFGKPAISTALHGARTLSGRLFSRTWENMVPEQTSAGRASGGTGGWQANLNRKANGLALEGPSVGLYVPLLEFNHNRVLPAKIRTWLQETYKRGTHLAS